jgi:poly(A) polymerase
MSGPRISAGWLADPRLQAAMALLADAGHQALIVGGAVRDGLLGLPVRDVDLATDAPPDRVMALAGAVGVRAVPTGFDHGTVTLVLGGRAIEVTTFRRDVETNGRHARVSFSTDVAEDAARRDFTLNALYADGSGHVIDPLGALPDLRAGHVRFVGTPADRIREDHLRILRFFRFTAWYGRPELGPDAEGLAASAAFSAGIETLSRERVGHEMRRLLAAADPAPTVASMAASGVLARALPGADARALAQLVHLEAGLAPDPVRRLAVLGGADAAADLRLTRAEAKRLTALREAGGGPGELGYRLGAEAARDALLVRAAATGGELPPGWQADVERGAVARFPIRAADLQPLAGPKLGRALAEREARWIASGFRLSREQLLA